MYFHFWLPYDPQKGYMYKEEKQDALIHFLLLAHNSFTNPASTRHKIKPAVKAVMFNTIRNHN